MALTVDELLQYDREIYDRHYYPRLMLSITLRELLAQFSGLELPCLATMANQLDPEFDDIPIDAPETTVQYSYVAFSAVPNEWLEFIQTLVKYPSLQIMLHDPKQLAELKPLLTDKLRLIADVLNADNTAPVSAVPVPMAYRQSADSTVCLYYSILTGTFGSQRVPLKSAHGTNAITRAHYELLLETGAAGGQTLPRALETFLQSQ